jgi:hypothetical protein
MNVTRRSRATSAPNMGLMASIATRVPMNSHGKLFTPLATPTSSRKGRMTYQAKKTLNR